MPDSGDIYNRLAMLGFGPEEVANMTPRQQLMYFSEEYADVAKSDTIKCDSMAEAERVVAELRAKKGQK